MKGFAQLSLLQLSKYLLFHKDSLYIHYLMISFEFVLQFLQDHNSLETLDIIFSFKTHEVLYINPY